MAENVAEGMAESAARLPRRMRYQKPEAAEGEGKNG